MSSQSLLHQVSGEHLRRDLFHLSRDPLPFRKVNYTRPGQHISSLAEADRSIRSQLEAAGWAVKATPYQVQPFRCDETKPLHHWYAKPDPSDPFYEAANLEATWPGRDKPEQIIQLISHKDSMSWIDSPGAHDNAVGTVANLELARLLPLCGLRRSVRILFCNEEHTPWTSRFAAEEAAARGDHLHAVLNVDSLDGKPDEEMAAGRHVHVITHSTEEGRQLAEFIAACAPRHGLDLEVRLAFKEYVNDDDGMFINAGFRNTVMNLGSWPYADAEYHLPGDTPDRVNITNVVRSTQLLLAAILDLDAQE